MQIFLELSSREMHARELRGFVVVLCPCANFGFVNDSFSPFVVWNSGPAAILFISRDTCSDSIAKLFRACFHGVSHKNRAICSKMGYRTDVPV